MPPLFADYRMPRASLTRRVTFSAAHRYSRPDWPQGKNDEVFGACAWPNYHGHSYVCDVTVRGPVAEDTGFVVDLGELDRILKDEILDRFDHRNINVDVAEFADGKLIPSGENLARYIFGKLEQRLAGIVQLASVTIAEDATLSASCEADTAAG